MEEIATYSVPPQPPDARPLTAAEIRAQVNLIQEVMKAVMKDGHHYGQIPGAGNKPVLFKAGAEKLLFTFRLSADPEIEDLSTGDGIRYRVRCKVYDRTGAYLGAGVGECSSDEEKYRWRAAVCKEEYDETPEDRRRMKYAKRRDGGTYRIAQVRTTPADLANTILKMAKKRAQIDAALTVTAASDIFAQDLEDLPEELREAVAENAANKENGKAAPEPPKPKAAPAAGQPPSENQLKAIFAMCRKLGVTDDFEVHRKASRLAGVPEPEVLPSLKSLTYAQASAVIKALQEELEG
ncbi:MAG: hypothetical protein A4E67_00235 [Syntrophaceae bacterium PtaB.Bin038]|nr:MAG: hypothetical protein A4E67_00235 [Syntrophaceae bacterium PtaB.Bin038]